MTKHCKSPKKYLKRLYARTGSNKRYPYDLVKQRIGGVAWLPSDRQKEVKKSLIAKELLLIG
jgi:hypothetical protein